MFAVNRLTPAKATYSPVCGTSPPNQFAPSLQLLSDRELPFQTMVGGTMMSGMVSVMEFGTVAVSVILTDKLSVPGVCVRSTVTLLV